MASTETVAVARAGAIALAGTWAEVLFEDNIYNALWRASPYKPPPKSHPPL